MRDTYLVVYDIKNATRLRKLAKIAEDYGIRLQKSVFEAQMDMKELAAMKRRMRSVIKAEEDGVKIFKICEACETKRTGAGKSVPQFPDSSWFVV